MAFVIGFASKGIAMGVGLASEGIHAHKEKKRIQKLGQAEHAEAFESTAHLTHESLEANRGDYEGDEAHWNLDEVQDGVQLVTPKEEMAIEKKKRPERNIAVIIDEFICKYPLPPEENLPLRNLTLPVILPQRRPKGRSRGFIRAYSPVLMDCGIDQPMFIDFLDTFNAATLASPWIQLLNLAGIAGNIIPNHLGIVLQVAIYITIKTAEEIQGRSRTNTYLDGMNEKFFRPRGLFCLVLTWNPESSSTQMSVDTNTLVASSLEPKHGLNKFHTSNGNTYGDFEFPEAAPLVFPALDEMAMQEGGEAVTKRAKMKRAGEFTSDYLDRRARAAYAAEHPNSLLAQGPKDKFTSRYADPTHPASSGNPWSLLTGGKFNPPMGQGIGGMLQGFGGDSQGMGRGGGFRGRLDGGFGDYGRGRLGMGYGGMNIYEDRREHMAMGYGGSYPDSRFGSGMNGGQGQATGYGYSNSQYEGGIRSMGGMGQAPIGFGGLAPVGKAFKKIIGRNILYLMIVNMPTEQEMAAAVASADKKGWST